MLEQGPLQDGHAVPLDIHVRGGHGIPDHSAVVTGASVRVRVHQGQLPVLHGPYYICYGPYYVCYGPYYVCYGPYCLCCGPCGMLYCV